MVGDTLFYIQDSRQYVGNCILWWCPDSAGYTTQLDEAGLYTAEFCATLRDTDRPYPRELVEAAICKHVRIEHLHSAADAIGYSPRPLVLAPK